MSSARSVRPTTAVSIRFVLGIDLDLIGHDTATARCAVSDIVSIAILGLTPQALCRRGLRALYC